MMDAQSHEGGCLCRQVRFRVTGESCWKSLCYCRSCCLATGAPAVAWSGFKRSQVEILAGEIKRYESSPGVLRGFCGHCGTTLSYEVGPGAAERLDVAGDEIYLTTTSFDDPGAFAPESHILYGERAPWLEMGDDLPRHMGLVRQD